MMEFGLQFFPDVGPEEKSSQQYWNECLDLVSFCDTTGFTQVRTVEHYFEPYGGYSPAPHIFLSAASQRSQKARFLTGAVLPIFNHPLKVAGEIGMLDAISNGRLDCGFGRAFLPHEFHRFGRSMDESRARFVEGLGAVCRLLEEENVSFEGKFHQFKNVTSLPRPTQKPRPPIWIAALGTHDSVRWAGLNGYNLMLVAFAGPQMKVILDAYREAWAEGGHVGRGIVAMGFHMFCHEDQGQAFRIAEPNVNEYFASLIRAFETDSGWGKGTEASENYPNYDKHMQKLRESSFESLLESGTILAGTPDDINKQIQNYMDIVGGFEFFSLQVNFHTISKVEAENSMKLFGERVIPNFL